MIFSLIIEENPSWGAMPDLLEEEAELPEDEPSVSSAF
jgi:hypothetical protein